MTYPVIPRSFRLSGEDPGTLYVLAAAGPNGHNTWAECFGATGKIARIVAAVPEPTIQGVIAAYETQQETSLPLPEYLKGTPGCCVYRKVAKGLYIKAVKLNHAVKMAIKADSFAVC